MVYLRSDGYGEYKAILGKLGTLIYHLMFNLTSFVSNFISCRNYILKGKKGEIVQPSQIDTVWLRKPKILEIKSFKLLYVGRIRVEKGVFSLVSLIKNKHDISLTIVGAEKNTSYKINQLANEVSELLSSLKGDSKVDGELSSRITNLRKKISQINDIASD